MQTQLFIAPSEFRLVFSTRMRILYITGDMGVEIGGRKGASTHVRETCHALLRFGHEVRVLTPAPGETAQLQFPVHEVKAPRAKWMGADLRYIELNRRMRKAVAAQIQEWQPDAIYERYSLYQTAGLELSRRHRIPRILEVNTLLAREQSRRLHWPRLAERVEKSLWRRETAVITVSETLRKLMIESAELKPYEMAGFIINPVAVDPEMFHPATRPAVEVQEFAAGRKLAGYAGTLTAWHGIDLFLDAAAVLRERGANCLLYVIGGDPARVQRLRDQTMERGLQSHLHFHGSIPHAMVPSYLAAMDLFLIPDTQDWSSPTKFFEFAAMARPIVASVSPSVTEVFGSDDAGFFFKRGSAEAMAESVVGALSNPEEARRRATIARQRVLNRYTWNSNIQRVMELYRAQGLSPELAAFPPPYVEKSST